MKPSDINLINEIRNHSILASIGVHLPSTASDRPFPKHLAVRDICLHTLLFNYDELCIHFILAVSSLITQL